MSGGVKVQPLELEKRGALKMIGDFVKDEPLSKDEVLYTVKGMTKKEPKMMAQTREVQKGRRCAAMYRSWQGLQRHVEARHGGAVKRWICAENTSTRREYQAHMKRHHHEGKA